MAKELSELADKIVETDVLVVGCGGAAARAAIESSKNNVKVTMVIKGPMGKCGATRSTIMDGGAHSSLCSKNALEVGLPGEWDPTDSVEELMRDFLRFGAYINNQKMVEVFCETGAQRVKDLLDFGAKGHFVTGYHYYPTYPRVFLIEGLMRALIGVIRKSPIQVIEDFMATDLLTKDGRVVGAVGLKLRTGEFAVIKAKAVVLGTGGWTAAYEHYTSNDDLTGDGHAMTYRAGAELVDMEMTHFLPLDLNWPPYATRSTFGCGWWMTHGPFHLYNVRGERFMKDWTPDMEATDRRELICAAILRELVEGRGSRHGGVYWSVKHLPTNIIKDIAHYAKIGHELVKKALLPPTVDWQYIVDLKPVMKRVLENGEGIEMSPAAHSTLGGVRVNEKTETSMPGLYAAGECTGGTLGAKRPGGSAMTDIQVFGPIAGKMATEYAVKAGAPEVDVKQVEELRKKVFRPLELKEGPRVWDLLRRLRRIAYYQVGSYRDGSRLEGAVKELEKMRKKDLPGLCVYAKDRIYNREWLRALELENMVTCIEAAARAAHMRTESRGVHYRHDYPNIDFDNWTKNIVVKQVNGEMSLTVKPIVKTIIKPPKGVIPWNEYKEMEPYVETTLRK